MTRSIINKGLASEQDVIKYSDQLLVDCYVQGGSSVTERKDPIIIEGFTYKFTACDDAGIPVIEVYQDENGEIKEVKPERPTPCKECSKYDSCVPEHCDKWLDWLTTEVMALWEAA